MDSIKKNLALFHLPGLFEFYDFYCVFLSIYRNHPEYFYDWCRIASIYGAPADCIWGGGRTGFGDTKAEDVFDLLKEYGISARLTFSNSLLETQHLSDKKCNMICKVFEDASSISNGVILHSDILLEYLKEHYPGFYFVSSTTKVITDFSKFIDELMRDDFSYVVVDFRLNKRFDELNLLEENLKEKVEFLCNECCDVTCAQREACYRNVSQKNLGLNVEDHICAKNGENDGYRFSQAMKNPAFIGIDYIEKKYLPMGFSNFKIEGRGLGSALLLEFILYYMVKPEFQLVVREEIYLDNMLDLF